MSFVFFILLTFYIQVKGSVDEYRLLQYLKEVWNIVLLVQKL